MNRAGGNGATIVVVAVVGAVIAESVGIANHYFKENTHIHTQQQLLIYELCICICMYICVCVYSCSARRIMK